MDPRGRSTEDEHVTVGDSSSQQFVGRVRNRTLECL